MTGEMAEIAVLPHTAVPTPIKVASFPGSPRARPKACAVISANVIRKTTISSDRPPIAIAAENENVAPRRTIARRRTRWKANAIPGWKDFGMRKTLPAMRPMNTATITSPSSFPARGGSKPCTKRAATAAARTAAKPGRIESGDVDFKSGAGSVVVSERLLLAHPQTVGLRLEDAAVIHLAAVDVERDRG